MSHITTLANIFTDLDCLEDTLAKFFPELELVRNRKAFKCYNNNTGDVEYGKHQLKAYQDHYQTNMSAMPTNPGGLCDHVIRRRKVEGGEYGYEIGLVKDPKSGGWKMELDASAGDGPLLVEMIGHNGSKLRHRYNKRFLERYAEQNKLNISETSTKGTWEMTTTDDQGGVKKIIASQNDSGELSITTEGFEGAACLEATADIIQKMGAVSSCELTSDYYKVKDETNVRQHGNA